MNSYRALMRMKLLEDIYNKLSEEDKRTFVQLTMQDKGYSDIMQALQHQRTELADIKKGQSWWLDLSSNVVGNAAWDGLVWLGTKLFKLE